MRASPKKRVGAVGSLVGVLLLAGVLVAAPASAATGFTPGATSGLVGASVVLTASGGNFAAISSVTFNGVAATFAPASGPTTTATVPATATDGPIRVVDSGTTFTGATFDVILAPTVTAVSPVCDINGGTNVTFTGTDMTSVSAISFGGTNQPTFVATATSVVADVPGGAPAGTITVTITNAAGAGTTQLFNGACAQTITSFSPTSGPVGTTVLITGTAFPASGSCDVYFGATKAATGLVNGTGTQITTVVPTGAVTGQVRAFCGATGAAASTNFTVTAIPSITSFTPTSGPAGTVVTITGANFTGATAVKFNNVAATTYTINSATQITATVPAGASTGKISVTTTAGTGTSTTDFTVIGGAEHDRRVTLSLSKHIRAEGKLSLPDGGPKGCKADQKVRLQKMKKDGSWKTIKRVSTKSAGGFSTHLPDRPGKYRARAAEVTLASGDVCLADASPIQKHRH